MSSRMEVDWDGTGAPVKVYVWGDGGGKHDISQQVVKLSCICARRPTENRHDLSYVIDLHDAANQHDVSFSFVPLNRVVKMDISERVAQQLIALEPT